MALRGKVVWFNNLKGYGFLQREGGPDVFCHFSNIQTEGYRSLKPDDEVDFDIETSDQGVQAVNVKPVGIPQA